VLVEDIPEILKPFGWKFYWQVDLLSNETTSAFPND
jgi:hypothetical protein